MCYIVYVNLIYWFKMLSPLSSCLSPLKLATPLAFSTFSSRHQLFFERFEQAGFSWPQDLKKKGLLVDYLLEMAESKHSDRCQSELLSICLELECLAKHMHEEKPEFVDSKCDFVWGAGKTWNGLFERIWLFSAPERQGLDPLLLQYENEERVFSAFIDREPPVGSLISLNKKPPFWRVAHVQEGKGGWAFVLTPVGSSHQSTALVGFRGTAARPMATGVISSLINDTLPELGSAALQHLWPGLKAFIEENRPQNIICGGKSLGGSLSQQFFALCQTQKWKLSRLITFQSPGVGRAIHKFCASCQLQDSVEVVDYVYAGFDKHDRTPEVGGLHLAHTLKARNEVRAVRVVIKSNNRDTLPEETNVVKTIASTTIGFLTVHAQRLGLSPHKVTFKCESYESIEIPKMVPLLERLRNFIFTLLKVITCGAILYFYKTVPMKEYIKNQIKDDLTVSALSSSIIV